LTAEVEGSEFAPYQVSIRLHDGGVAETRCSCPYDWSGYCKHIVAVLLKFADEATRVIDRKPIAELLRGLDQARLVELLEKRAESDLELAAWIEAELTTAIEASSPRDKEAARRRTPVDPEPVREHARNLLAARHRRGRYWDGYRSSGDMEELQRLVEKAVPEMAATRLESSNQSLRPSSIIGWSIRLAPTNICMNSLPIWAASWLRQRS